MYGSKNIKTNGLESECMKAKKWGLLLDLVQKLFIQDAFFIFLKK